MSVSHIMESLLKARNKIVPEKHPNIQVYSLSQFWIITVGHVVIDQYVQLANI